MKQPLLDIENLKVMYGQCSVVQNVSLQVSQGEILGIVGERWEWQKHTAQGIHGAFAQ